MIPGESIFGTGFADDPVPVAAVSAYRQAAGSNATASEPPELSDDDYDLVLENRARLRELRADDPYSIYD